MAGDVVSHRGEELVGKLNVKSPKLNLPNHRLIGGSPKKKFRSSSNSSQVSRKSNAQLLQTAGLNLQLQDQMLTPVNNTLKTVIS